MLKSAPEEDSVICPKSPDSSDAVCDTSVQRTITLRWAPDQDVAVRPASVTPDSGLSGWSCQKSLKTVPWEAGK